MSNHFSRLLQRYPSLQPCADDIGSATQLLAGTFSAGNKLLVCGNGGSAADSEHIVGELMKGFVKPRPIPQADATRIIAASAAAGEQIAARLQGALPAISLTSPVSLNSAIGNDIDFEMIFAQQVYGLGRTGDALLGISTSGDSANVVNACIVAKAVGLKVVALSGRSGGRLAMLADVCVRVPADDIVEIQELHLPVYHTWCVELEERFF